MTHTYTRVHIHTLVYIILVFLPGLRPGSSKNFCRSHADLWYSFWVYYSELRSSPVFSKCSSVIISKAPD